MTREQKIKEFRAASVKLREATGMLDEAFGSLAEPPPIITFLHWSNKLEELADTIEVEDVNYAAR